MSSSQQVVDSAIQQRLIRFVLDGSHWRIIPGSNGNNRHIFLIRNELKAAKFRYNKQLGWHKKRRGARRQKNVHDW